MRGDGKIDHVEFPATNLAATRRFYGGVFGWSFRDRGPAYAELAPELVDGGTGGGFAADPATAPSAPLVVLYADHLGAMRDRVRAAGAIVTRDIHDFPGGRRFHFRDPAGNELAVWSEADRPLYPAKAPTPTPPRRFVKAAQPPRTCPDIAMDAIWRAPRRLLAKIGGK